MFVVTVTFTLRSGAAEAFLPLMLTNARTSLAEEAGCRHFDVCVNAKAPDTVFLYEVYDDRDAFNVHLASPHFRRFEEATAGMVADKLIRTFTKLA